MSARVPDPINCPAFKRPDSGWLLTAVGTVLGIMIFALKKSAEWSIGYRLALCAGVALAPVLFLCVWHACRCLVAFLRRGCAYTTVFNALGATQNELATACQAVNELLRERDQRRGLKIAYCYCSTKKETVIALCRKRNFIPQAGDRFHVFDMDQGRVLGVFEVTDTRDNYHFATGVGPIDPLWLGYIQDQGGRSEPPPNSLAINIRKSEDDNDN